MTGVVVHNKTGGEINVTVKYTSGEKKFSIHQQIEALIVEDYAKNGGSRSPQLREDLVAILVSYGNNQQKTYTREQLLKVALWERKSRQWILTIQ